MTKVSDRVEDSRFTYHMHPFLDVILSRVTKVITMHYETITKYLLTVHFF